MNFQIEIYQWLGPIVAIFFIYRIISQFRANRRLLFGTVFWVLFWLIIILLSMFPDVMSIGLATSLGFKDHINAVIFVALGFLFVLTYNQSSTIENLEKQVTKLVRNIALEKQQILDLKKELEAEQINSTKTKQLKTKTTSKSKSAS